MLRFRLAISTLIILLSSCSPLSLSTQATATSPSTEMFSPSATSAFTLTPSNTPIPLVDLEGLLFFDYNGDGLHEEAEPSIADFTVCINPSDEQLCAQTEENGRFVFSKLAPKGSSILVTFTNPNAQDPALAFRYINLWKSSVVLPAYEINGINVPEQHLVDAAVVPLAQGAYLTVGEQNSVGLSQGFLTFPFKCGDKYQFGAQYDHDPGQGNLYLWNGETKSSGIDPISGQSWSSDNHDGTDLFAPEGTPILATAPGTVNFADVISGSLHVTLDHLGRFFQTGSGHMSQMAVSFGKKVYRGQIIGFVGHSGTSGNHLHFNLHDLQLSSNPDGSPATLDPWRSVWDSNSISFWTKDNDPQCIP